MPGDRAIDARLNPRLRFRIVILKVKGKSYRAPEAKAGENTTV
ncbi:MAG: hypothetical protein ACLQVN_20335 [Bryobacteraceae bacterium]